MSIQACTPAKPAEILLMQIRLTMSTNSLLHISVGNSIDLRGVINVINVTILQHYTVIYKYTYTMIMRLGKKLSLRSAKTTMDMIQQIICKGWQDIRWADESDGTKSKGLGLGGSSIIERRNPLL
jgi:hypothetical protein